MYVINIPTTLPENAVFKGREYLTPQDDGQVKFRCSTFGGVAQRYVCYTYPVNPAAELEALYVELGSKAELQGLIDSKISFVPKTVNHHPVLVACISGWLKAEDVHVEAVKNFKAWANKNHFRWIQ